MVSLDDVLRDLFPELGGRAPQAPAEPRPSPRLLDTARETSAAIGWALDRVVSDDVRTVLVRAKTGLDAAIRGEGNRS